MAWYSPLSGTFASHDGGDLLVEGPAGTARLSGAFATEFLAAFLSPAGGGGPHLDVLGRGLGPAAVEAARRGGGRPWEPLASHDRSMLFLEVTGRCNERCVHCYADSSPEVEAALDEATCRRVLGEGAALGFTALQLTGGDPLLCPFLPALALAAREAGYRRVEIYTNGLALSDERLSALAEAGVAFAFSYYSVDARVHDRITGVPGSAARTLDAIRRCAAHALEVRAAIVAMPENEPSLAATRDALVQAGVPPSQIHVDRARTVGRGQHVGQVDLEGGARAGAHGGAPSASEPPGPARWPGKLCVSYAGLVYPCIFARWIPLGDVRRESLEAIARRARAAAAAGRAASADRLACVDCRMTAVSLGERGAP